MKKNYQILEFKRIDNEFKLFVNKNSNYKLGKDSRFYSIGIEFAEDQIIATKLFKINKVKCLDTGFIFEVGDNFSIKSHPSIRFLSGFWITESGRLYAYYENSAGGKIMYNIDDVVPAGRFSDLKKQTDKVDMFNDVLNKFDAAVDKFFNDRKRFKDAEREFDKYANVKKDDGGHTHRVDNTEPVNWEADSRIRQGTLDSPNICSMSFGRGEPAQARKEVSDEYVLNAKLFSYNDIVRDRILYMTLNSGESFLIPKQELLNKAKELCGKK